MQSSFWSEGTSLEAEKDSRKASNLSVTDLQSGMRKDITFILENVAKKVKSYKQFNFKSSRDVDASQNQV